MCVFTKIYKHSEVICEWKQFVVYQVDINCFEKCSLDITVTNLSTDSTEQSLS